MGKSGLSKKVYKKVRIPDVGAELEKRGSVPGAKRCEIVLDRLTRK